MLMQMQQTMSGFSASSQRSNFFFLIFWFHTQEEEANYIALLKKSYNADSTRTCANHEMYNSAALQKFIFLRGIVADIR